MNFDPAIEAQIAFQRAHASGELSTEWARAEELEEIFSASAGAEAREAYRRLVELGQGHAQARSFHEFLIYITWQQVTEHTVPEYFRLGTRLCDSYLSAPAPQVTTQSLAQVQELRRSFREGLGLSDQDELGEEYERDAFKGGD